MKSTTRLFALLALGAIVCGSARQANAQTLLYDMAGSSGADIAYGGLITAGFDFTLSSSKTLTALGFWDVGSPGLDLSHPIGIWDSRGTLLASATVTGSSTTVASADLAGQWLFQSISSVVLGAGTYTMGALGDGWIDTVRSFQGTTTMSGATIVPNGLVSFSSSLDRPTFDLGDSGGYYGPNAMFAPSSVPEPSSFALLLAGAAPLGLIARKRLRRIS